MPKCIIKPRSATKAEWESANPILKKQEIGYEVPSTGIGKGKIKTKQGDGVTAWKNLPYSSDNVNADDLIVSAFDTVSDTNPALSTGQTLKRYLGVIKKKFDYYLTLINGKIGTDKIYSGLDSSNSAQVLAAPAGKQLKQLCDNNATAIAGLNSDLVDLGTLYRTETVLTETTIANNADFIGIKLEAGTYLVSAYAGNNVILLHDTSNAVYANGVNPIYIIKTANEISLYITNKTGGNIKVYKDASSYYIRAFKLN